MKASTQHQLYSKSDQLFLQLSAYYKKLMHDHKITNHLTIDQRKILKLFNFQSWQQFMTWIHDKLEQGGQLPQNNLKNQLPEIIQEEPDLQESISEESYDNSIQCQIFAIQNAKLRKQNIIIQDKIQVLQKSLFKQSQIINQ